MARSQSPLVALISRDDYPVAAVDALDQGAVTVELEVNPTGRVSMCRIIRSSGSAALDTTTCRILTRRARFSPARDSAGYAIVGRVEQRIRWELDSLPLEPLAGVSIARTNAAGAIIECKDHTLNRWCTDPDFQLSTMAPALGARPPSSDLVRTMTFTPGDQRTPEIRGVSRAGDRSLYSASARIALSRNGKVTDCTETGRTGGRAGALCKLARTWLFKVDPEDREMRSGVWRITLASRSPAAPKREK